MADVSYVSINNAIQDFYQDTGLSHTEIDFPVLIKWATDVLGFFNTHKELSLRLAVIQINNSRGLLPPDFKILNAAAGRVKSHPKQRSTREQIVQWTQDTFDKDCQLEINLVCKRCHKTKCECETPIVEVKIDDIWRQAHPEAFYKGFDRVGRFGYGPGKNGVRNHDHDFHLMRYTSSNFFNYKNVIAQCPNIDCDGQRGFYIDRPWIETDFGEGEVLISYLGVRLDEDGNPMMPSHPDVFEAVLYHLKFKWFSMLWDKQSSQTSHIKAQEYKQLRDESIAYAKSSLDTPSALEIRSYFENSSMLKRVPLWSGDYIDGKIPDLYDEYLKD